MDISTDKIFSKVDDNLQALAFFFQITQKDVQYAESSGYWKGLKLEDKLKYLADVVGGRTIGFNPFPEIGKFDATFNLGNAINKTSETGLFLWALSEVGLLSAKWGKRGKDIIVGGAIGGVFDAPVPSLRGQSSDGSTSGSAVLGMALVR